MVSRSSRHALAFVLTLALPAAFASVWAWLEHGGTIERTRAAERSSAEHALEVAAGRFADDVQVAAAQATFVLQLDDHRAAIAPFADVTPAAPAEAGIAEQAAFARLQNGDPAGARDYFAHAHHGDLLSHEGLLAYADLIANSDPVAARTLLAEALARDPAARCSVLPFALLAALREASWLHARQPVDPAALQHAAERLFAAAREVPAAAVAPVVAEIALILPSLADDERRHELAAAAESALRFRGRPAPRQLQIEPDGVLLVPCEADRLAVLPPPAVARLRNAAFAAGEREHPESRFAVASSDSDPSAPRHPMALLDETWLALPRQTPMSTLLTRTARAALALALLTLVAGNLLLWRLTRREHALARLRTDFVDIVSHELRTPLAALSLKAEMLAAGDVPSSRTGHYLQTLRSDVQRLNEQVERILDFGRLERGAPLRLEPVNARKLLADGLRAGRPALRLVQQQLAVDAPRALPAIAADAEVLGRALRNLLENAAKYAPAGSTVELRAFVDGQQLHVEVADRGPGVPAAERDRVFEPFARGSNASGGTPGSGLGLALVAAAARAHGGTVAVRDREGGGSVFTLRLPLGKGIAS